MAQIQQNLRIKSRAVDDDEALGIIPFSSIENLAACLRDMKHEVIVPEDVASRAKRAIDAMLAI